MPLPLIPIAIGLGLAWYLAKYKGGGGGLGSADVRTAVYNALAFEHDPGALNAFADELDKQGYHQQAALLRQHAREMTSSDPSDQQSVLTRRGLAALKAGGH